MTGFSLVYLADYPKAVDACAAWDFGHWDVRKKGATLEKSHRFFARSAQKDALPLSVVVRDDKTKLPVAMASLWEKDGREWASCSPWVASVYVHPKYRGLGLARDLVVRIEEEARRLGYDYVYLKAGSAAVMYEKFGYVQVDETKSGVKLFKKDLV